MAPKISPNKTWSGFLGGIVLVVCIALVVDELVITVFENSFSVAICILISFAGQMGDLFVSWVKRKLNVKDTGTLIPGHGGVLDRIDSILLATPVAGFVVFCFG